MAKIVKTNRKRRFCRLTSCKRPLSMYNFSIYCHVHQHIELTKQTLSAAAA